MELTNPPQQRAISVIDPYWKSDPNSPYHRMQWNDPQHPENPNNPCNPINQIRQHQEAQAAAAAKASAANINNAQRQSPQQQTYYSGPPSRMRSPRIQTPEEHRQNRHMLRSVATVFLGITYVFVAGLSLEFEGTVSSLVRVTVLFAGVELLILLAGSSLGMAKTLAVAASVLFGFSLYNARDNIRGVASSGLSFKRNRAVHAVAGPAVTSKHADRAVVARQSAVLAQKLRRSANGEKAVQAMVEEGLGEAERSVSITSRLSFETGLRQPYENYVRYVEDHETEFASGKPSQKLLDGAVTRTQVIAGYLEAQRAR